MFIYGPLGSSGRPLASPAQAPDERDVAGLISRRSALASGPGGSDKNRPLEAPKSLNTRDSYLQLPSYHLFCRLPINSI